MSCPLCQQTAFQTLKGYESIGKYDDRSDLVICNSCGHHYLILRKAGADRAYFEDGKYQLLDTRKSVFDRIKEWDAKRVLKVINKQYHQGGRLLDFGCGKGLFLSALKGSHWKGKGIETAEARANFGKAHYQVDIDTAMYASGKLNEGPFEVITLFHVLEHLDQPNQLLQALIDDNLKEGGTLIIEVPLFSSWQSKIAGRRWIQLDPPLHISHFDDKRLEGFLTSLGLTVYNTQTFSLQLGLLGMIQSILSRVGYHGDYIEDLKFNRTKKLLLTTALVLPFAFVLEIGAVLFQRGGVIRLYAKKHP